MRSGGLLARGPRPDRLALEAGIVATACCLEPELRERGLWPPNGDPTRWTLGQAIDLATAADWLPAERPDTDPIAWLAADVGDAVKFLNDIRKLAVHPGVHAREQVTPTSATSSTCGQPTKCSRVSREPYSGGLRTPCTPSSTRRRRRRYPLQPASQFGSICSSWWARLGFATKP